MSQRAQFTPRPPHEACLEAAGIGNELRALGFEHFSDRLIGQLWMAMCLGVSDAFVEQPSTQLGKVLDPRTAAAA